MSGGGKLNFFENFMLSGVAAGVSKTVAAPIERVKLLVQNQDEMIKQGRLDRPYDGVVDCCKRTLASEGVAPFWRGNLANVLRYFPTQALNFAFKDTIKAAFATPKSAPQWQKFATNIASGGFAGSLSLTDVYKKTLASDGIGGLYRGFVISCVGIFIYRGLYFGLYDSLKPIIVGDSGSAFVSFFLGWSVTIVSGLASYPIDTIRRRMMMTSGGGVKYNGAIDCGSQILKNG